VTILIIHGSPRKNGCSSNIALNIASEFKADKLLEINLQKENLPYCAGCLNCVNKGIEYCSHSDITLSMRDKMLEADLIIIAVPVYILHMSGQLKTFIDHFPSIFLMHRPEKLMFNKQLIIVATAAGPVCRQTLKEIKECFTYFGVSKIYELGIGVHAKDFKSMPEKKIQEVAKKSKAIIKKVKKEKNKHKVAFKIRSNFLLYRMIQKKFSPSKIDHQYWLDNNWFDNGRPWK
jgi:multimeric flavodoxin WrbA